MRKRNGTFIMMTIWTAAATVTACSSMHSVFVGDGDNGSVQAPIRDPFNYAGPNASAAQPTYLRSKKGDRTVELELPPDPSDHTDLVVPLSSAFKNDGRAPASSGASGSGFGGYGPDGSTGQSGIDESYLNRHPSMSDREITSSFPQTAFDDRGRRADVEQALGVIPAEDSTPQQDASYLAGLDRIKQLYRLGRFEAALIESDAMIRDYQTDAHLYEMRGTLLDRIGKRELAIKSWNQALRFDPANARLKRFVERKRRIAGVAESTDAAAAETRTPASKTPAAEGDSP